MIDFEIGLGCGVRNGISTEILDSALEAGIRFFDTSTFYPVGAIYGFDDSLKRLNINRGVVHLSLKLWLTDLGHNRVNDSNSNNLSLWSIYESFRKKFNVQRFDTVVVHWPLKVDADGHPDEFRIEEVWPQLEQLLELKIISGIGVSNFNIIEMQRLLNIARIKPYSAQFEYNPFAHDDALVAFCRESGIKVIGHSPFGFGWVDGHRAIFDNDLLKGIASRYHCSVPQIVLAWSMKKGVAPIPGTTRLDHLKEIIAAAKLDVLTADDVAAIDSLNQRAYHYTGMFDYFGMSSQKKYLESVRDIKAWIYNPDGRFDEVSIFDIGFMPQVKEALTEGAGFIILPALFDQSARALQDYIRNRAPTAAGRWNGMGPNIKSVLNSGTDVLEIVDDSVLSLIIESLLGWDCKLDNISLSTSRIAPDNAVFGPHQDSPFDNNPGAPLPPPSYPMVLQVIVAIDEFKEDNGPLYVIPYSHKRRQRVNLPWHGNLPSGKIPDGAVKAIAPKGSAIIAVGHIWHGTFPNDSDKPRMGMLVEFVCSVCDARDKFTASSIEPTVLENCSRRVVRLLNNGKLHQHDSPSLLVAYKIAKGTNIPTFAGRPDPATS